MSFYPADFQHLVKFNSATSCKFIDDYEAYVKSKIQKENSEPKSQTFAPSSVRCKRISWFRLRGVQPDLDKNPDLALHFTADIGTACHRIIQENLIDEYKEDWISVEDYLDELQPDYNYKLEQNGFETQVEIFEPHVKFACDGILRINGKYYLLEIKSAEHTSFDKLTDPKEQHIDQIKCYATLLHIHDVLVLYIDRQYGSLKCFEVQVPDHEMFEVRQMFEDVEHLAKVMIAPPKLPTGDSWCTPSRCIYYKKCQEW